MGWAELCALLCEGARAKESRAVFSRVAQREKKETTDCAHNYFSFPTPTLHTTSPNTYTPTMPPAAVPETALKKRTRDEAWATTRAEGAAKARAARAASRKDAFKRAESYVKEYRAQV